MQLSDITALERAFMEAKEGSIEYNSAYQAVFERVASAPAEQRERLAEMTRITDTFIAHAKVWMLWCTADELMRARR